jgi:hypothetical protein
VGGRSAFTLYLKREFASFQDNTMRRVHLLILVMILMVISGLAVSQSTSPGADATEEAIPEIAFAIEGEIDALPRKIVATLRERMAVVDAIADLPSTRRLLHAGRIARARRIRRHRLHSGRWLAVAYGITMELGTWRLELAANLDSLGNARYPRRWPSRATTKSWCSACILRRAPANPRPTSPILGAPAAARREAVHLPDGLEAVQMVDFANGFVLSPDDRFVAACLTPARAGRPHAEPESNPTTPEQDLLTVWNTCGRYRLRAPGYVQHAAAGGHRAAVVNPHTLT